MVKPPPDRALRAAPLASTATAHRLGRGLGSALASALLSLGPAPLLVPVVFGLPLLGGGQAAQAQTPTTLVKASNPRFQSIARDAVPTGIKFTTGSKPAKVTDVRVYVLTGNGITQTGAVGGNGKTVVRIRAGNTEDPTGDIIATLTNPSPFTTNEGWNTFTAPANTFLKANTTYFLTVNDGLTSSDDFMAHGVTSNPDETGVTGWSIANRTRRATGVNVWGDGNGVTLFEIRGSEITLPGKPMGLTAFPSRPDPGADRALSGFVGLDWKRPSNRGAITQYQYDVRPTGGSGAGLWSGILGTDADSTSGEIQIPNQAPGTKYDVRIRGFVGGEVAGEPSEWVTVALGTVAAPTGLTAVAGPGSGEVTLEWDDPGNRYISKYQVYSTYTYDSGGTPITVNNAWADIPSSGSATTAFTYGSGPLQKRRGGHVPCACGAGAEWGYAGGGVWGGDGHAGSESTAGDVVA